MLSWDDFRYVKVIAEYRSLTGAASALSVNHSTVFRRLGSIEQQLGSRLFERGRGGYALTPAGEEMVRLAERLSEDIATFERKVTGQDLRPSGELRITTNDMVLLHLITDVLVDFRRAYPEILIEVVVSNAMLNLTRRDADVAVRATYTRPEGLSGHRIANIAWAVFGAKSVAPAGFVIADAAQYDWIGVTESSAMSRASKWLRDNLGEQPRLVYRTNTLLGLAQAAAAGAGLVLLPCFIGSDVPGLVQLTPPLPELQGEFWVVSHPDLQSTARVRAFSDFCAKAMEQRRGTLESMPSAKA